MVGTGCRSPPWSESASRPSAGALFAAGGAQPRPGHRFFLAPLPAVQEVRVGAWQPPVLTGPRQELQRPGSGDVPQVRVLAAGRGELLPRQATGQPVCADGLPIAPLLIRALLPEELVTGPVEHPRHQLAPPVGTLPLLRITLRHVAVRRQLHIDDIVPIQVQLHERPAGGADVPLVVGPARLVLVAADRYIAEEDMAVPPQTRHVEELVRIQRDRSALRQVYEERARVLTANRHGRMVTAATDNPHGLTCPRPRGLQALSTGCR